jgi:predicted DNA-binding protein
MSKGEKKRNLVAVRLTDEELDHLKYLADKDDRTYSYVISHLISVEYNRIVRAQGGGDDL